MKVNLLYEDKEWGSFSSYFDWSAIVTDLGLDMLFMAAGKDFVFADGRNRYIDQSEGFLPDVMSKVMRVPLRNRAEVEYRQSVLKDCVEHEAFTFSLYELADKTLKAWNNLGRKSRNYGSGDSVGALISEIQIAKMLFDSMNELQERFEENRGHLHSLAFLKMREEVNAVLTGPRKECIARILRDVSFYADTADIERERNSYLVAKPRITVDCGIQNGLKLGDMKLEEFETLVTDYVDPKGIKAKLIDAASLLNSGNISLSNDAELTGNVSSLEFQIVKYVYGSIAGLMKEFGSFFEKLKFQIGFYKGAINLRKHMYRFGIDTCFPVVSEENEFCFEELKEVVMRFTQKCEVIGNTTQVDDKLLLIITGANQGGKSTYLRSIGIAQVMMQCGLMVAAKKYKSALYPDFFTHFTRREDSAMNSGRLDEELQRMDQIINHIGEKSLLLLNESFASTTEKEGSIIAYDIIKALKEEGVKIITVTHLLSFAQKVYDEYKENLMESDVAFLCAERLEGGVRTFKMIPHEPELTSFGLDLYEQVMMG